MAEVTKSMGATEWSLLVFLSVLWGSAFFFVGVAIAELPPLTVAFARVGIAAAILVPIFLGRGYMFPHRAREWAPFLVMGLLNNVVSFSFLNLGQTYISVGLASIINAMTPLFAVVILSAFGQDRFSANRATGVILGVCGVAMISWRGGPILSGQSIGIGLCLLGTLGYGFAALWGNMHLRDTPPLKSATCQLLCSTMIMGVIVAIVDLPWTLPMPGAATWGALFGLAVFGTGIAYIVFFQLLTRAGGSNAMLVTLLIPVSAMALGSIFLNETIFVHEIVGAATIGTGLLVIDGRIPRIILSWISR